MQMFEVGGCVRDELLGVPSKDIDFSVVLGDYDREQVENLGVTAFSLMVLRLQRMGFKIFLESPEFLTVRAQFPKFPEKSFSMPQMVENNRSLTADFVLARKEADYTDGRRPDKVEPGTLIDDLSRRDFTINAIAKDADGNLIDPFDGQKDIKAGVIRTVGDPDKRFEEDALRVLRAIRFAVTKRTKDGRRFIISGETAEAMQSFAVLNALANNISEERMQVELSKMFRFDTIVSMKMMQRFDMIANVVFGGKVSLDATLKQKGRNGNTGRPKPNNGPTGGIQSTRKCF